MAIGLLVAVPAAAGDRCGAPACCNKTHECCHRCGVSKTCKVVCEMKKVKKTVWAVECEEFCAALPRCPRPCKSCGDCGKASCASCCEDPCASLRRPMVPPKCGKVRCRKKLVKKEITCEVPVYKCVVVCCNAGCCEAGCGDEVEAPAPAAATTRAAPLPPFRGASYLKSLRTRYLPK